MAELNAAVVGAGFIALKKHLPAFKAQRGRVRLAAICDPNLEAAQEAAREFGIPAVYASVAEMLANEELGLVDVCTPPRTHEEVALLAIESGCHVLIEKPMAVGIAECDRIIEASNERGVKVSVVHSDLFYPPFMKARELVARGEIGDFMGMRIFLSTPTSYMTSREDHWAHRLPGGVIGESGPHVVYMTLAFINPVKEVKVHALKCLSYPWSKFEDYRLDLIGERAASTVTSIYTTDQWAAQVDIWGTRGELRLDLEVMSLVRHRRPSLSPLHVASSGLSESVQLAVGTLKAGTQVLLRRFKKTHDILIERFVDSILLDTPPPVSAEEGREAVRVMGLIVDQLGRLPSVDGRVENGARQG